MELIYLKVHFKPNGNCVACLRGRRCLMPVNVCCSFRLLRVQGARVHITVAASAPRPADWRKESAGEGGRQDQSSAG